MSARSTVSPAQSPAPLALGAIAAPTAGAHPAEQIQGGSPSSGSAPTIRSQVGGPAPTVTRTTDDGFDWGSAAIGAGGAAAVLLLTGAGASAVSHRHHRVGAVG
jgi:hypothetical protein